MIIKYEITNCFSVQRCFDLQIFLVIYMNHDHWSLDVQSSGQIFFSRRFTHFQNISQKLSRIKFVCISLEVCVQSGERYKNMFCF